LASTLGGVSAALFILALALLYWHFLGYVIAMAIMRRRRKTTPALEEPPTLSVVIPVYNEANNLRSRVENLLSQDYSQDRVEIIIVESGSTDGTAEAARELEARTPNLRVLIQPARLGKASAVAEAKRVAKGSIIVVTDANTVYDRSTLAKLVEPFSDARIGGVGGRFVPKNVSDPAAAGSALYWSIEEILRAGEAGLDSCCTFHGEVYAWRRDLVEPDPEAIIDDLDSAIQIRKKGYRIGYAPEAVAFEVVPTSAGDMAIQWKKNALGAIQCAFRHARFLWTAPNYYTYLIFPSHKGLQVLQPFLLLLAAAGLLGVVLTGAYDLPLIASFLSWIVISVVSASLASVEIRRESGSRPGSLVKPVVWIRTFFAFQWAVLLAWRDYVLGRRDVRWEKVESTRV